MDKPRLTYVPAAILREKARKVTQFNQELRDLADHMVKIMRQHRGIGLAAPQVGVPVKMVTIEYVPEEKGDLDIPLMVLVNPTITDESKQIDTMEEGCLSIPGVELPVERSIQINVLAEDLDGRRIKIRAKDMLARILQHEIDHTNGVLMTDRAYPQLSRLKGLKVAFMGTPEHAANYLTALASTEMEIVGVITETDKPAGRKQILTPPPVKQVAEMLDLPVYQFKSLKSEKAKKAFKKMKPDLVIVVAYGKVIPVSWLEQPKYGFLNVHYSLLPEYRGSTPHQTAIRDGKQETGFTIFKLDSGLDTGPILIQKPVKILANDTSDSLIYKMISPSIAALFEALPGYISGDRKLTPQDNTRATHTQLLAKEDGRIDWSKSVLEIDRQIRAVTPWPGAYTEINGERLIIRLAHRDGDKLVIDLIQPAGKQSMTFADFRRGNPKNALTFLAETGKVKVA